MKLKYLFILTALILFFFLPFINGGNLFFAADESSSDLIDFNFPQRAFYAENLKAGKIPIWTQNQSNGFPFLAEAQTGVFYPINLIFFYLLPTPIAFNMAIVASFFILGIGTFLFLKEEGLSDTASLFGGITVTFAGFFITQLKHVQLLESAAFLPWVFLFTLKIIKFQKLKFAVFLSLAIAFSFLAGHLPTSYAIVIFAGFYFFLRIRDQFSKSGESLKPIYIFSLGIVLAILTVGIQILPTLEMIPNSTRGISFSSAGSSANYKPSQLLTFINPFVFGDPSQGTYQPGHPSFWENTGYYGLIALVLALYSFFIKKNAGIYKILFLLSFFIVIGWPDWLFKTLWDFIPGLSLTRIPSRFLLFVDFFGVILAAFAFDKIVRKKFKYKNFIIIAIILVGFLDLYINFGGYNGQINAQKVMQIPSSALFLKKDSDYFRITNLLQGAVYSTISTKQAHGWRTLNNYYLWFKEFLPATTNSLFDVKSIHFPNEYSGSFSLGRRSQLSSLTSADGVKNLNAGKILGVQNVKYIISPLPLDATGSSNFKKVFEESKNNTNVLIYENKEFLPRAYIVPTAKVLPEASIVPYMTSDQFDPKSVVILEKDINPASQPVKNPKYNVQTIMSNDNKIELKITSNSSGILVLTDTYYPGWLAKIDGNTVEILRANYAFRAVVISPGDHDIVFEYKPKSFYAGIVVTALALTFDFGVLVFYLQRRAVPV